VQAAKVVHRLASGSHKRWSGGAGSSRELHVYPASRGQVLRHAGKALERATELLCEHRLGTLLEVVTAPLPRVRARPRRVAVRRRKRP
jgi:hypothetical protein